MLGIIGTLLSMILPVLARARESAESIACQSNLHQIHVGWVSGLSGRDHRMPYTSSVTFFELPRWHHVLDAEFPGAPVISDNGHTSFNACPTIQRVYRQPVYSFARWGYAINMVADSSQTDSAKRFNDRMSWDMIRNPSQYPIFMDPEVYEISDGTFIAARSAPNTTASQLQHWGVGAPHGGGEVTNAVFADGSVSSTPHNQIMEQCPDELHLAWFDND